MEWNKKFLHREPISISRILQLPLIIIVLASILSYRGRLTNNITCYDGHKVSLDEKWQFPFNLNNRTMPQYPCKKPANSESVTIFDQNLTGLSLPIVVAAILGLIHVVASLVCYMFCWASYTKRYTKNNGAVLDLGINFVMLLFWTGASIAWLIGMIYLYKATKRSRVEHRVSSVDPCGKETNGSPSFNYDVCSLSYDWEFGALFASPIAGFCVAILHLFSLWHIYLQTPFGRVQRNNVQPAKIRNEQFNSSADYKTASSAWPAY